MKKRLLSLLLTVIVICAIMPQISLEASTNSMNWDVINTNGISGTDIVDQARTYLGVPYDTSGGDYKYRTGFGSTMMFDCSGFVYRVCRDVGLASSRQNYSMGVTDTNGKPLEGQDSYGNYYITAHTQEQRYYGENISAALNKYITTGDYSDLRPGDLLFLTSDNSSVSHVVIYAGEGKIIHSEGYQGCVAEHPIGRYPTSSNWYFDATRLITGKTYGTYGKLTFKITSGEVTITDCDTSVTEVIIPNAIDGYPVTAINSAFRDCKNLLSVTIPDSVTSIGSSAFENCTSLESITIPDSVTSIDGYAFQCCSSLTSVTIPDSVTGIGYSAFSDCSSLTSVTIPDSVTSIGDYAFRYCSSLTSVTIPDSVTSIGFRAFDGCSSLTGIWVAEDNAVYSSDSSGVLFNKDKTKLIQAHGGISGAYAIPYGVAVVDSYAFCDCKSLTEITIPSSVTEVKMYAFNECESLTGVYITDLVAWCGVTFGHYGPNPLRNGCKLFLNGCEVKNLVIPDAVNSISDYAFAGCTSITSVIIPSGVTYVGAAAFDDCVNLTSAMLSDGVGQILSYTFSGCNNLSEITLPDTVTDIAYDAFSDSGLTNITLPNSIESIGFGAFNSCDDLTDVYYVGTEKEWKNVNIVEMSNDSILNANIHYLPKNGWGYRDDVWVFYENGKKVTNCWKLDSKGWCYLTADGTMATNQWILDSQGWCYVGADGYCLTDCWIQDSTGWCYLDSEGRMAVNKWILDSAGWCYVGSDGYCLTNCWMQDSIGWCFLDSEGRMATDRWILDSVGWCYVGADGYCVTNCWMKDSIGWCYLDANGRMVTNGWVMDSKGWCYLGSDGYAVTNCWKQDSTGWCYLDSEGSMVKNAWVDGCYVNSDGYWVQ